MYVLAPSRSALWHQLLFGLSGPGQSPREATLAFLGVFDPVLPTWGKVINEAVLTGNLIDRTHWILEPVTLLALTGLAFASLGFALERVLNPRLRQT